MPLWLAITRPRALGRSGRVIGSQWPVQAIFSTEPIDSTGLNY
jgi:hypothetical protein